jgi:hypothetical protein
MTVQVNERSLVEQLRAAFPELEKAYQEWVRRAGGELPSNFEVVGFVLKPRLQQELTTGALTDFVERSAAFFERVCTSDDAEALNAVWLEIFEWLMREPQTLKLVWPVLGKQTRSAVKDAAATWGYTSNLP